MFNLVELKSEGQRDSGDATLQNCTGASVVKMPHFTPFMCSLDPKKRVLRVKVDVTRDLATGVSRVNATSASASASPLDRTTFRQPPEVS